MPTDPAGPWTVHPPGSLHLAQSGFLTEPPEVTPAQLAEFEARYKARGAPMSHDLLSEITTPHIASPDVHVDPVGKRIVMYFHGLDDVGTQVTRVATSRDGIDFAAQPQILGRSYMRVFAHDGMTYAMAMPGHFLPFARRLPRFRDRSDAVQPAHAPRRLAEARQRALGFLDAGRRRAGTHSAEPCRSCRRLDRLEGRASRSRCCGRNCAWEGADAPLVPSVRSTAYGQVNQLRDPAILEDEGRVYLFYAVAGESGIALAEDTVSTTDVLLSPERATDEAGCGRAE